MLPTRLRKTVPIHGRRSLVPIRMEEPSGHDARKFHTCHRRSPPQKLVDLGLETKRSRHVSAGDGSNSIYHLKTFNRYVGLIIVRRCQPEILTENEPLTRTSIMEYIDSPRPGSDSVVGHVSVPHVYLLELKSALVDFNTGGCLRLILPS